MRYRLRSLVVLLPLGALAASAEPISVSFIGTITATEIDDGTFTVGDPVAGSFQIDPDAVDSEPSPDAGRYVGAVTGWSVTFGAYEATDTSGLLFIRNGTPPFTDEVYVETNPTGADVGELSLVRSIFGLLDNDVTVFDGDGIPAALDLAEFEDKIVTLDFEDPPFTYVVTAGITSLTWEPVPEAPALPSLAAGALVLGLRRLAGRPSFAKAPRGQAGRCSAGGRRPSQQRDLLLG